MIGQTQQQVRVAIGNYARENWRLLFPWDEHEDEKPAFLAETEDWRQWGGAHQNFVFACMHQLHRIIYEVGPEGGPQQTLLYCHRAGMEGVYNHYDRLIPKEPSRNGQLPWGGQTISAYGHRYQHKRYGLHARPTCRRLHTRQMPSRPTCLRRKWDNVPGRSKSRRGNKGATRSGPGSLSGWAQVKVLTINVTGSKESLTWAMTQEVQIILLQEHKALSAHLPAWQALAKRHGWNGVWEAAIKTPAGGLSGGVAILTRDTIPLFRGSGSYDPEGQTSRF